MFNTDIFCSKRMNTCFYSNKYFVLECKRVFMIKMYYDLIRKKLWNKIITLLFFLTILNSIWVLSKILLNKTHRIIVKTFSPKSFFSTINLNNLVNYSINFFTQYSEFNCCTIKNVIKQNIFGNRIFRLFFGEHFDFYRY